MLDLETKQKFVKARNILLHKIPDPQKQVEQITTALMYKFMDDIDNDSINEGGEASFFIGEYEKFAWSNLFDPKLTSSEMFDLYISAMDNLTNNPNFPQEIREIFKNSNLPFNDPKILKDFLVIINEFSYDDSEKLGDAFEYLLSLMSAQGDSGQFRTPRHIIDFLVEILGPKKTDKILDPSCGTAGMLISAYKYILRNETLTPQDRLNISENFVGYDISPEMVKLSLANMFLHKFKEPRIHEYDTLTNDHRWDEDFDLFLSNPPFMTPAGGIKASSKFSIKTQKAEVLFINYMMDHFTSIGRAGIIVPEGIVFNKDNAYVETRKKLVEKYLIGVVSLPSGVFLPYSGVTTKILVLDRVLSKNTDKIFFTQINNDGFELNKNRNKIDGDEIPEVTEKILKYKKSLKDGTNEEIDGIFTIPKKDILDSKYVNLNYDFYVSSNQNSEYPLYDIRDIVDFKKGKSITKKKAQKGNIPVIAGGKKPACYHNEPNRTGESITISTSGSAGFVGYYNEPIWASDCMTVKPKNEEELNTKFLYHILKYQQEEIYKRKTGAAVKHIYEESFDNFKIPLPPIETQMEILEKIENNERRIKENLIQNESLEKEINDQVSKIWK